MMLDSENLMADENGQCDRRKNEGKSAFVLSSSR